MVRLESSKDKKTYELVKDEIKSFNHLMQGHEKILKAIAQL